MIFVGRKFTKNSRSNMRVSKVRIFKKGGFKMAEHFCTCADLKCPNHPRNQTGGCDFCIQKNLKHGEIPACFFRAVSANLDGLNRFTYESFAEFVRQQKQEKEQ